TGSGLTYDREHSWTNSLGFGSSSGDLGLPNAPYTDTHMLYLTDTNYNSDRGNKPYADCPASSNCGARATEANGGRGGGNGAGDSNWVKGPDGNGGSFEPWDARKGDMARAVMYMAIRYEGGQDVNTGQSEPDLELTDNRSKIVKTSSSPAYMGLLSTLLAWHQADPPDDAERARNEVVYSFQGNRNPFIDQPEWATQALFESAQPATCEMHGPTGDKARPRTAPYNRGHATGRPRVLHLPRRRHRLAHRRGAGRRAPGRLRERAARRAFRIPLAGQRGTRRRGATAGQDRRRPHARAGRTHHRPAPLRTPGTGRGRSRGRTAGLPGLDRGRNRPRCRPTGAVKT